jgi:hypothetical protein
MNMLDFFKPLFEFLKLTPRYLMAIGLVAGMVLFGSNQFRETLGLTKFSQDYRSVLGIAFLSSIVLLVVAIAGSGWNWIQREWMKRKAFQRLTKRLNALTEDEKQILRHYVKFNTRSNCLRIDDGVVQGLVNNRIIFRSTTVGSMVDGFPHNISEATWDYLHACPEVIKGESERTRTDKIEW